MVFVAAGFPCDYPGELTNSLPGHLNAQWRTNRDGTRTKPSTAPRRQRMLTIFWANCLLICVCCVCVVMLGGQSIYIKKRGGGLLLALMQNLLCLYAPSSLHKGFLTVLRVWVQATVYSDSVCLNTGGVSYGASCKVPSLGGV